VSKDLLETDHLTSIRSFRSGHLAYPDSLIMGLDESGYSYNSSNSANNVLTSFPYYAAKTRSFNTTMSSVIEIPLTISDVIDPADFNANDYTDDVNNWITVSEKYAANNSPITHLIHPNRQFKVDAMDDYYTRISSGILPYSFEDYGDFWAKRRELKFHSTLLNDTLRVYFDNNSWETNQSMVIDDQNLQSVHFYDVDNKEIVFNSIPWNYNQRLYYITGTPISTDDLSETTTSQIKVYPNPFNNSFVVDVHSGRKTIEVIDLTGKMVWQGTGEGLTTVDLTTISLKSGMYFLQVTNTSGTSVVKIIKK